MTPLLIWRTPRKVLTIFCSSTFSQLFYVARNFGAHLKINYATFFIALSLSNSKILCAILFLLIKERIFSLNVYLFLAKS
jgi:hypothetical protein